MKCDVPGNKNVSIIKINLKPILDQTDIIDNGTMSILENIDTKAYPYIAPIQEPTIQDLFIQTTTDQTLSGIVADESLYKEILRVYSDENNIVFVLKGTNDIVTAYVGKPKLGFKSLNASVVLTGTMTFTPTVEDSSYIDSKRKCNNICYCSIANDVSDVAQTTFSEKIYSFDNRAAISLIYNSIDSLESCTTEEIANTIPQLRASTVNASRIYGAQGQRIIVSNFNFSGWTLDTASNHNSANAWLTIAASDDTSDFHTIISYNQSVYAFKDSEMYEISGTKNPYRIQRLSDDKVIRYSVEKVNGLIIFFTGNKVISFDGSFFENISKLLDFENYIYTSENRNLTFVNSFAYKNNYIMVFKTDIMSASSHPIPCPDDWVSTIIITSTFKFLLYDTEKKLWTNIKADIFNTGEENSISGIAFDKLILANKKILCNFGYKNNTKTGISNWAFCTGINYFNMGIKKLHKFQVLCEIQTNAKVEIYLLKNCETYSTNSLKIFEYSHNDVYQQKMLTFLPVTATSNITYKLYFKCSGYIKFIDMQLEGYLGGDIV